MRQIGSHSFTEVYFGGCNPSFVETSDGVVMIDSPQHAIDAMRWKERMEQAGPIRYLINTEPHGDHIIGNAFYPEATVVAQQIVQDRFDYYIDRRGGEVARLENAKKDDPDSVWLMDHPDFSRNPPRVTFEDHLEFELGNHQFQCIHMPGHTAPQTSVFVPSEGVVFTGDNVFCKCKSWLQEADPWLWLDSLQRIATLDAEVIVPGHGWPCTKEYLKEQAQIIENWMGVVGRFIEAGMSEDEAAGQDLQVRRELDPYPVGQKLYAREDDVTIMNIRNLYRVMRHRIDHPDESGWNRAAVPIGFVEPTR